MKNINLLESLLRLGAKVTYEKELNELNPEMYRIDYKNMSVYYPTLKRSVEEMIKLIIKT